MRSYSFLEQDTRHPRNGVLTGGQGSNTVSAIQVGESREDMAIKRVFLVAASLTAVLVLTAPFFCYDAVDAKGAKTPVNYNLYFGDLHSHTSFSDGWEGTPETAYLAARTAAADFLATTDHNWMLTPEEWAMSLQMADECTSREFVAMAGYEYWMPSSGEINVYGATTMPPSTINPANHGNPGNHAPGWDALPTFYDWLSQQSGASGQWNHPDYMTKEYVDYAYLTKARDKGMNIIEIHNYGSWLWKGTLDYETSYVMALDSGWHVMPAANSDTHSPDWISGYESRTVLLAPDLTRADLYDAMSACRGYATLDSNLRISYTLNGEVMGSTLSSGSEYTAVVHIQDPDGTPTDAVTLVEIVSDGGQVVARLPAGSCTVDWTVTLDSGSAHYYYIRVTTNSTIDGGPGLTAWTAPVWTGR